MSETQTTGVSGMAGGSAVAREAIAQAATRTGVDFNYLLAQAKLESSLDPDARASTSSAAGLFQFTRSTWLQTLDRHGETHGLSWAGDAISGGRITDSSLAPQIMELRYDAGASALMAAELARDNAADLSSFLGREPDAAELYLGHFLGSGGARRFLGALSATPDMSAAGVLPQAASANRRIFYERTGAPRSVSGVMDLIRNRMATAMEQGAEHAGNSPQLAWGGAQARFDAAQGVPGPLQGGSRLARNAQSSAPPAPRLSMADMLQSTFGTMAGADGSGAPTTVRNAYAKLNRLGL
ncbi:MAG: transglycosylase SLT domain-containing protein [Caenibius sp.]